MYTTIVEFSMGDEKQCPSHTFDFARNSPQVIDIKQVAFSTKSQTYGGKTVHFIDEGDTRNVIFVRLPPNGFALGFDAFTGTENDDSAVECEGKRGLLTPNF